MYQFNSLNQRNVSLPWGDTNIQYNAGLYFRTIYFLIETKYLFCNSKTIKENYSHQIRMCPSLKFKELSLILL